MNIPKPRKFSSLLVLQIAVYALPVSADVIFSDLLTSPPTYNAFTGYAVGTAGVNNFSQGSIFTTSGDGILDVAQIDLGFTASNPVRGTFNVSIWTAVGGLPDSQVPGASWDVDPSRRLQSLTPIT